MDGENNGKPYEQMDDLGVSLFLETSTYISPDLLTNGKNPQLRHFKNPGTPDSRSFLF